MSRPIRTHKAIALIVILFLGANASLLLDSCTGPNKDYLTRLALVISVSLPDTVQVAETFSVIISTEVSHGGCRPGRDDVQTISNGYRITPYDDIYVGPDFVDCALHQFSHNVEFSLASAGISEIQIRHHVPNSTGTDSIGTIIRQITVLP